MTEVIKQRIEHLIDQGFDIMQICKMQKLSIHEVQEAYNQIKGKVFHSNDLFDEAFDKAVKVKGQIFEKSPRKM